MNQTALPIRTWGAFMPPNGVGGGGVHWNAETWRFLPSDFVLRTHLTERYGAGFLPDDMTIQDWGVTYEELEPHYDRFEYLCGTSRTGRQPQGPDHRGRQSFRGTALAALPQSAAATAVRPRRCSPRRRASSATSRFRSRPATCREPTKIRSAFGWDPAPICGFCEWFGCGNYSKSTPQTTILPALLRKPNFSARDNCEVTRINLDRFGQARDRRHLRRYRAATNGSSRPIS